MKYEDFNDVTFAVVSNYSDYNTVVLAKGLKNAINTFLHAQKTLTSLLASEDIVITGQDADMSMPLLTVFANKLNVLNIQIPSFSDGQMMKDNKLVPSDGSPIIDACTSFVEIAYKLNKVILYNSEDSKLDSRFSNALKSFAAHHLASDHFTSELIEFEEVTVSKTYEFDVEALSVEIDNIKLLHSTTVTVE